MMPARQPTMTYAKYLAMIDWPAEPRWTEPDEPLTPEAVARIQERLQFHRRDDVRIGGHLPWQLRFSPDPETR